MDKTFDISRFFDKDAFSDITIVFDGGNRKFKAHKMILCTKSEYFMRMLGPSSQFPEAEAKSVELFEDDPEAMEALFKWLYTFDYGIAPEDLKEEAAELGTSVKDDAKLESSKKDDSQADSSVENENNDSEGNEHAALQHDARLLNLHMNVYIAADKYQVEGLKSEALSRFIAKLQACHLTLLVQKIEERLQPDCAWPAQIVQLIEEQQTLKTLDLVKDAGFRDLIQAHASLGLTMVDQMRSVNNQLRWTYEQMRSANEQMRSTTHQLESTNRQLQSQNQQLQSTQQQLQSTQQQLQTTNQQLQSTNQQLALTVQIAPQYTAKTVHICTRCNDSLAHGTRSVMKCDVCRFHNDRSFTYTYHKRV